MKKILNFGLIATLFVIASCATQVDKNPNYAANLEVAKSFMLAHASEDIAAQTEMLHDDLVWQPPFYGAEKYGKAVCLCTKLHLIISYLLLTAG